MSLYLKEGAFNRDVAVRMDLSISNCTLAKKTCMYTYVKNCYLYNFNIEWFVVQYAYPNIIYKKE